MTFWSPIRWESSGNDASSPRRGGGERRLESSRMGLAKRHMKTLEDARGSKL